MTDESNPEVAPEAEDIPRKRLKRFWKIVILCLMLIVLIFVAYFHFVLWPEIQAKSKDMWHGQAISYDTRGGKLLICSKI